MKSEKHLILANRLEFARKIDSLYGMFVALGKNQEFLADMLRGIKGKPLIDMACHCNNCGDTRRYNQQYALLGRMTSDHALGYAIDYPNKVSYCRKPEDKYNQNRRVALSLQKYIRRVLSLDQNFISDYDLTVFCNVLNGDLKREYRIISGDEMYRIYAMGQRINGEHNPLWSCMVDYPEHCLKLYAINPDKVNMVALLENDKLLARALLWRLDSGKIAVDRVFPEYLTDDVNSWAKTNGYLVRSDIGRNGEYVTLSNIPPDHEGWPYIDTLYYIQDDGDKIILHTGNLRIDWEQQVQDGRCARGMYEGCSHCSYRGDADDMYCQDGAWFCSECYHDLYFCCTRCGHNYSRDDEQLWHDDSYCESCIGAVAVTCDCCGELVDNGNVIDCGDGYKYCPDCFNDHGFYCDHCENDFSQNTESYYQDGKTYCQTCFDDVYAECDRCGDVTKIRELTNNLCEDCVIETERESGKQLLSPAHFENEGE